MSTTEPTPFTPPKANSFSIRNVLIVTIPLCLIIGAVGAWFYLDAEKQQNQKVNVGGSIKSSMDVPLKLDTVFVDEDSDLVADAPKDGSKLLDPTELIFSTLGRDEVEEEKIWKDFLVYLKSKTGKEVKLVLNTFISKEQLQTIAEGKVHLAQLSTGNVPSAVNVGGYVPFCVMADEEGKFGYQMEMITPAKSDVQSLKDLRGKTVAYVNFRSHSGFKNPVVQLWSELSMYPDRDYQWKYAGRPELALRMVQKGEADAAPVASDFLKRELSKPEAERAINQSDFRVIFNSKTFPPACFGHSNHLKPELAESIKDAFLTFPWKGTSLETGYKAANQTKFVKINYKDDWAIVREVDEQMMKFVQTQP